MQVKRSSFNGFESSESEYDLETVQDSASQWFNLRCRHRRHRIIRASCLALASVILLGIGCERLLRGGVSRKRGVKRTPNDDIPDYFDVVMDDSPAAAAEADFWHERGEGQDVAALRTSQNLAGLTGSRVSGIVDISRAVPFRVYSDGWLFGDSGKVRGAGGINHAEAAKVAGADALRTWGREQLHAAFESATRSGLRVAAGMDLTHDPEKYSTEEWCNNRNKYWRDELKMILADVTKYKANPALLLWTVGNEIEDQISLTTGSDCLWRRLEWIVQHVKSADPNHPVGTVTANVHPNKVSKIRELCPSVDFLGVNVYGSDSFALGPRLIQYGWQKPYAITEYGVPGWWSAPMNAWGSRLEPITSTAKGAFFTNAYRWCAEDDRCIGSFAFTWGWKWENTGTWFNLFNEWPASGGKGYATDLVYTLSRAWNGDDSSINPPVSIRGVVVHGTEGVQNPVLGFSTPSAAARVQVDIDVEMRDQDIVDVVWLVTQEKANSEGGELSSILGIVQSCATKESPSRGLRALVDTSKLDVGRGGKAYRLYAFVRTNLPSFVDSILSAEKKQQYANIKTTTLPATQNGRPFQHKTWRRLGAQPLGHTSNTYDSHSTGQHHGSHSEHHGNYYPGGQHSFEVLPSMVEASISIPFYIGKQDCYDTAPGEQCHDEVRRAMEQAAAQGVASGVAAGLLPSSSFEEFQAALHRGGICPMPCAMEVPIQGTGATCAGAAGASAERSDGSHSWKCKDSVRGDKCFGSIRWTLEKGIRQYPQRYPTLSKHSSYPEVQLAVHKLDPKQCPMPCSLTTTTSTATTTTTTAIPEICADALQGDMCDQGIQWARRHGLQRHPQWYPGLTRESSPMEFQLALHRKGLDGCPLPCFPTTTVTTATTTTSITTTTTAMSTTTTTTTEMPCWDAKRGEQCYRDAEWGKKTGIFKHPEWFDGLSPQSSLSDFQKDLYLKGRSGCAPPCPATTPPIAPVPHVVGGCHDAMEGEECYKNIEWAMEYGIHRHPDWYPGLSWDSTPYDFQVELHKTPTYFCPLPCAPLTTTTTTPATTTLPCQRATPQENEECYEGIRYVQEEGIRDHPDWFPGLTTHSTADEIQMALYRLGRNTCPALCGPTTTTTTMEGCHDALLGEECHKGVTWAKRTGIYKYPASYLGLSRHSSFRDFQYDLHEKHLHGCPLPCYSTTTTATTTTTTATTTTGCRRPQPEEACYVAVEWAKTEGIMRHPEWYPALMPNSSFDDFQMDLHKKATADKCPPPCAITPSQKLVAKVVHA